MSPAKRTCLACAALLTVTASSALAQFNVPRPAKRGSGLTVREPGAFEGYNLFSPLRGKTVYLVDMDGQVVHTWRSEYLLTSTYLLADGHLIGKGAEPGAPRFTGGGEGGRIQKMDWEGNLIWDFRYATDTYRQHHDIEPLPSGNVLMIVWQYKSREEALQAGRAPELLGGDQLWPDSVVEIEPVYPDGGKVIWEWHVWDHLVQEHDSTLDNFGVVAEHPERVDINGHSREEIMTADKRRELEALGYVQPQDPDQVRGNPGQGADWLHVNAIHYNAELDQIALSVPQFNEIWIIDHSTTTDEAAGNTGGKAGRGGDLLYRWGNPVSYGASTEEDRMLFYQHDVRWIPAACPGEGNLTIYNNGGGRSDGNYSTVVEIAPPLDIDGSYFLEEGYAFEPVEPDWEYRAEDPETFFSGFISGAHRLPNGNTFVCEGATARLFEITVDGEMVWEYWNPYMQPEDDQDSRSRRDPNGIFRASRLAPDHPGLAGRSLSPLDPQPLTTGVASSQ